MVILDLFYDCELVVHTLLVLHVKCTFVTMLERRSVNLFQVFKIVFFCNALHHYVGNPDSKMVVVLVIMMCSFGGGDTIFGGTCFIQI